MVWKESLKQAQGMLKSWVAAGDTGITSTHEDTKTLALHVLTSAGFGRNYDFQGSVSTVPAGHSMSFEKALQTVLTKFLAVIVTASLLTNLQHLLLFLPKTSVQLATEEFKLYLSEMVEEERASTKKKTMTNDNLMSALVRASDLRETQGDGRYTLSDDEIYGNLFIYSFAGHDTTASALSYALALLATDTRTQSWIKDEIRSVTGSQNIEEWGYERVFPQLKRCMAVMVCLVLHTGIGCFTTQYLLIRITV